MIRKLITTLIGIFDKASGGALEGRRMFRKLSRNALDFNWKPGRSCPRDRVEGNGTVINDKFYLFGGYQTINHVQSYCDVYDLAKNKWVDSIIMPANVAQTHMGVTSDGQRYIYITGGQVGAQCSPCTDACFVFDTQTKTFSQFISLPEPRYVAVCEYWNGRVHIVGGSLQDRYSPATDHWSVAVEDGKAIESSWRKEVSIPRGGIHRGSAIINDTLYVIGGCEGDVQPIAGDPEFTCDWNSPPETNYGEAYKLEAGSSGWERIADLPIKLAHTDTTVVALENEILVFGGTEESRLKCTDSIWRYYTQSNKWEKAGHLPYHMKSTLAHYHDGKFYLVTGQRSLSAGNNRPSEKGSKTVWISDVL